MRDRCSPEVPNICGPLDGESAIAIVRSGFIWLKNDHLNVTPLHRHRRGVAIAATGRLSATLAFASGGSVSVSTEGNAGAACGESFS
jgi:hypothetical protein